MPEDDSPSESDGRSRRRAPSGEETAQAVQQVLKDQAERKARQKEAAEGKKKKRLLPLPVVAVLWSVACLVVWAATPQFLLPEPLPEPTSAEVQAGLRMEMVSLVGEIEAYQEQTGRAPETLSRVVEEPPTDVRYTTFSGGGYRITGDRAGVEIIYQSGDPVDELVEPAKRQIQTGSQEEDPTDDGSGGQR